ncbi:MAG: RNA repair transcriptional activator RtcR [Candidatus Comchoanobacterales bacterium]
MIVIGFLGTVLDGGAQSHQRWQKWRPTISLCQQEDIIIHRFELLIDRRYQSLADQIVSDIKQVSPETHVILHPVHLKDPWDFEEVYSALYDFTRSYDFDLAQEEYFIHLTTGTHVAQICMFLLTLAHYFPAKILQSSPPKKNKDDPGHYTIIDLDISKYDRIAQRFKIEQEEATSFLKSGIHTRNQIFNDMIDQLEKVVIKTKSPVMLMGPIGVGKSQLARRIYDLKKLRHQITGPFVEVSCATLKGDSAMSALFGHKKMTFTGTVSKRSGLLAAANKGVLFLDEIGELGLDEQAMILHALQEKKFFPVGSDKEVTSDFQLVVGTNKDLAEEVAKGHFRGDLLARLNLWVYSIPGLKDRRDDIEPNIDYELCKYSKQKSQNITFNKEARVKYVKFCLSDQAIWSANFLDLSASINRMATLSEGGRIQVMDVESEIQRLYASWHASSRDHSLQVLHSVFGEKEIEEIDLFDQVQLARVIEICKGENSMSAAGRRLFSNTRAKKKVTNDADRLSKYLARFGLTWKRLKGINI